MMMGKFTGDIAPALFANPLGFQDAGLYLYGAAVGIAAALGLGEITWETTSVGEPGLSRVKMALYCDGHGYPLDRYTTAAALAHWLKGVKDGTATNPPAHG